MVDPDVRYGQNTTQNLAGDNLPDLPMRSDLEWSRIDREHLSQAHEFDRTEDRASAFLSTARSPVDPNLTINNSKYGYRKVKIGSNFHKGLDFIVRKSEQMNPSARLIYASADGTVSRSANLPKLGEQININHNPGFMTRYGHLEIRLVDIGEKVQAGEVIGIMGNTGSQTSGEHLHFEVREGEGSDFREMESVPIDSNTLEQNWERNQKSNLFK